MQEIKTNNYKHGRAKEDGQPTKNGIYRAWVSMRSRCKNENHIQYGNYGGRGIKVCQEWDDFRVFLKDMGEKPQGSSLDRIDNNGNYCKENCRWTDTKTQCNNKRTTKFHNFDNKLITRQEYLQETGLNKTELRYRQNKEKYKQKGLKKRERKGTFQCCNGASRDKNNPLHSMYKTWGYIKTHASGMCESWEIFNVFVEDMGIKPEGKKLARHFSDKPFCKENCYWK